MNVQFCDLCSNPMKEGNYFSLYLTSPNNDAPDPNNFENNQDYYSAYNHYLTRLEKDIKEICPSCKIIFDKIFECRLDGMCRLTEECEDLFNLPPKIDRKKKPKDKDGNK